ncbi:MAG TPA: arsenate reductase [Methylophilaceae bacterium]|nr:arsenate reductase [Methylophilaceae bacterium]
MTKRDISLLQVYGIKNCNTVKKSLDWLSDNNHAYEFFDVKKGVLDKALLREWIQGMSISYTWLNLVNKASSSWKQLSSESKAELVTSEDAINMIIKKPTIMKRPVITRQGKIIIIGFDQTLYKEQLK